MPITVAHPANWGSYKMDLLRQAFLLADLTDVQTCSEPEAAAITYASRQRVDDGACIAVYDLGGGTFDAAVLRNTAGRFTVLGTPEGIEHLGGVDFDEAVFQHVLRSAGIDLRSLDPEDPQLVFALDRLRRDCVAAKEALSTDIEAVVAVGDRHHAHHRAAHPRRPRGHAAAAVGRDGQCDAPRAALGGGRADNRCRRSCWSAVRRASRS